MIQKSAGVLVYYILEIRELFSCEDAWICEFVVCRFVLVFIYFWFEMNVRTVLMFHQLLT